MICTCIEPQTSTNQPQFPLHPACSSWHSHCTTHGTIVNCNLACELLCNVFAQHVATSNEVKKRWRIKICRLTVVNVHMLLGWQSALISNGLNFLVKKLCVEIRVRNTIICCFGYWCRGLGCRLLINFIMQIEKKLLGHLPQGFLRRGKPFFFALTLPVCMMPICLYNVQLSTSLRHLCSN